MPPIILHSEHQFLWWLASKNWGLIYLVVSQWQNPALQGFHLPIFFDTFCVLVYVIYLVGQRKAMDNKGDGGQN